MQIAYVCGSKKPWSGNTETKSAARGLLQLVMKMMEDPQIEPIWMDVRDYDLPFFDGRTVEDYGSEDLIRFRDQLIAADAVVFSVPSYWGGVSGVLKNAIDVLGGALYDYPDQLNVFKSKQVAILAVGAEDLSAYNGAQQFRTIMQTMGAWVLPEQVVVGNMRNLKSTSFLAGELEKFAKAAKGSFLANSQKVDV